MQYHTQKNWTVTAIVGWKWFMYIDIERGHAKSCGQCRQGWWCVVNSHLWQSSVTVILALQNWTAIRCGHRRVQCRFTPATHRKPLTQIRRSYYLVTPYYDTRRYTTWQQLIRHNYKSCSWSIITNATLLIFLSIVKYWSLGLLMWQNRLYKYYHCSRLTTQFSMFTVQCIIPTQ